MLFRSKLFKHAFPDQWVACHNMLTAADNPQLDEEQDVSVSVGDVIWTTSGAEFTDQKKFFAHCVVNENPNDSIDIDALNLVIASIKIGRASCRE